MQIVSLECSKEPTPKAMLSDGIACSVKVLCSEELESPTQHKWIVENVKSTNDCPVLREESIPRKLYLALLKNRSVSHALQFIISAAYQIRVKVV